MLGILCSDHFGIEGSQRTLQGSFQRAPVMAGAFNQGKPHQKEDPFKLARKGVISQWRPVFLFGKDSPLNSTKPKTRKEADFCSPWKFTGPLRKREREPLLESALGCYLGPPRFFLVRAPQVTGALRLLFFGERPLLTDWARTPGTARSLSSFVIFFFFFF